VESINIIIDSSIRFNPQDLPKQVLDEIFNQLRVPNPQKSIAEREMLWNADDIPEYLEIWKYNGHNELILPRGFLFDLDEIFKNEDIKYNNIDKTLSNNTNYEVSQIDLRDYQWKAFHQLMMYGCGIYKAPTGAGKSHVMLEVIRQAKQKSLIICEKRDIAQQWYRTANMLGFNSSLASGHHFNDNCDLVIVLRQTLWHKELDQEWYNQWGLIVWDEMHHLQSAETAFELIQRFPAYYRYGCSATPDSDRELFPIARAVIGPVVHETKLEEIGDHLVIPSVKVVKTDFEFPYRPTVRAGRKVVRNNYNDMMQALEEDKNRNIEIMSKAHVSAQAQRSCLVVSKRKKHLNNLYNIWKSVMEHAAPPNYGIYFLTGDNSKEFNKIKEEIENSYGCIVFSTLADEGTDIPRLDRIFLAYPGRKLRGFEQTIGRIMRPHPKKKDAIVYDFRDYKVPILNSQYRFRAQNIYNKKGYKVETING
jgi:superfamily II DNA or RNA helicase